MIAELCSALQSTQRGFTEYIIPPAGERAWKWFWELDRGRGGTGFGANPISWSEMAEWMRVTGSRPARWEIEAITEMDRYRIDPDYDPAPPAPRKFSDMLRDVKEFFSKKKRGDTI